MTSDHTGFGRLTRRRLLRAGAGLAGASLLGAPAIVARANAQSGFDWQRYKGQKIEVSLSKSPRGDLLQKYRKEFETLTGITVGDEQVPEQQQRQKVQIEFTSGHTTFDVVMIALHVQKRLAGKGKWMEDLRPYLADASMTAPDFDFADFAKAGTDYSTQPDGRIDSLPINLDYFILYWNKELFEKKGVAYPTSHAALLEAARKLHDPKAGISGWTSRGLKNANIPPWATFMLGWDVDFIDPSGKLMTETQDVIASAELYRTLCRDVSPPGTVGYNWNECQSVFAQGKAAMWLDGIGFALPLEDPNKSRVVGKVGYGVMPPGPKAHRTSLYGDGVGISSSSSKKGPAWYYCQWATNKLMQARNLQGGYGSPPRKSAYTSPETVAHFGAQREFLDAMIESARIARPGLPEIMAVSEFRDIFGIAITNMIGGADPASELKKATAQFQPILDKESA